MVMLGSEELFFPVDEDVGEGMRHLRMRTTLYLFLKHAFKEVAVIGSDQFVYWDPTNPKVCLAPDAFVRFGSTGEDFDTWKVWEQGAPHVAVEIISDWASSEAVWEDKLDRYRRLGVGELVWFNDQVPERPLRIWDFVGDELLERHLLEPWAQSRHLGGYWLPVEADNGDLSLRLSRDEHGLQLFLTPEEHYAREREREAEGRRVAEQALAAREKEAERRIAELEAELRRRS